MGRHGNRVEVTYLVAPTWISPWEADWRGALDGAQNSKGSLNDLLSRSWGPPSEGCSIVHKGRMTDDGRKPQSIMGCSADYSVNWTRIGSISKNESVHLIKMVLIHHWINFPHQTKLNMFRNIEKVIPCAARAKQSMCIATSLCYLTQESLKMF